MKPAIVLIGPGRVGCAFTRRLYRAGYPLAAIIARDRQRALEAVNFIGCPTAAATTDRQAASRGQIILLTLPDDQLTPFSAMLAEQVVFAQDSTLIHCSGLHPASILQRPRGDVGRLSIHPLLPFADRQMATEQLLDCPCAIEGDEERLALGKELVNAVGGKPFLLASSAKQTYHTAASIASNFMVSLTACARDLLVDCGLNAKDALTLLGPLQTATLHNIQVQGPEQALTGPIVRGDLATVASHLQGLQEQSPEVAELYRPLAVATLKLARISGRLPAEQAAKIKQLLK